MKKEDLYIASNIKFLRLTHGKTQEDLAKVCNKQNTAISNYEKGIREPDSVDLANIANYFNITVDDLLTKDLRFDNGEIVDLEEETSVQIPVLGIIKAGIPVEAQQDILEYIDIPKSWLNGGKSFYGLKISGDSMFPKYSENDIVIFEKSNGIDLSFNKKDCAVMVNGYDATFKNVTINDNGISLVPLNLNNTEGYQPTFYTKEQIESLPVNVIGVAREKRTRF